MASLPDGLDTVVGERGYRFSGGERQRLTIARLLLARPRVVILDEATAHLDSTSEAAVQAALADALDGRTAIVIAHRLSTIGEADEILVIEDGRVVERGTHAELLAAGGRYAELYRTQFREESTPVVEPVEAVRSAGRSRRLSSGRSLGDGTFEPGPGQAIGAPGSTPSGSSSRRTVPSGSRAPRMRNSLVNPAMRLRPRFSAPTTMRPRSSSAV